MTTVRPGIWNSYNDCEDKEVVECMGGREAVVGLMPLNIEGWRRQKEADLQAGRYVGPEREVVSVEVLKGSRI